MPEPQTLVGAWKEMRKMHRQQQNDPGYEFDRPIPPTRNDRASDSDEALAASIGDLAPQALRTLADKPKVDVSSVPVNTMPHTTSNSLTQAMDAT